jgi:hypothetical protein
LQHHSLQLNPVSKHVVGDSKLFDPVTSEIVLKDFDLF